MDTAPLSAATTEWQGIPANDAVALSSRYDIVKVVGQGGMGTVFKARHRALDMVVAVKVTHPGVPRDRFLREAKLLAKVQSPSVVGVHDFEVLPSGCPMLVMEWVEGADLSRTIKDVQGLLEEATVLPWMRHTCEGMRAAAEQGIIHRDLKPSNILIDERGRARVVDFGLARGPDGLGDLTVCGSGVMGTPYYMAPEQAEDPRGVDTRADVYSFGATFYHALTGAPPFEGDSAFQVLFKHKMEPLVSPAAKNPTLSERVTQILERCLAKSPADRFQSFADLLVQLQPAAAADDPWAASPAGGLRPHWERFQARQDVYLHHRERLTQPDVYEFRRGRTLKLFVGDLVKEKAEVLVSSDDADLTMGTMDTGVHGVAKMLLRTGGPAILREASRYVPVRPGRVVVTSAGTLPVRFIFHAVTLGASRDPSVRPSRDLILELLASCFYHADTLYIETIAFPLLGTGKGGFSEQVCLDTMFRYLARTLLTGVTSVREARIVLAKRPRQP
jgi:eukaryotic-like serine/threonine-protein kinase